MINQNLHYGNTKLLQLFDVSISANTHLNVGKYSKKY